MSLLEHFSIKETYIVFFTVLLGIYIVKWLFMRRNLPPGPYGLPLVGYVPFLDLKLEEAYKKLSEKYGEVFGLNIGQRYMVILSSWESIKEAFIDRGDVFSGRPKPFSVSGWLFDYKSVITSDSDIFKEQKKFILSTLRLFGFGKASIEGTIHEEAETVINLLKTSKNPIDDVNKIFNTMTTNIICSIAFGKRFQHSDEKLKEIMEIGQLILTAVEKVIIFEAFPYLRFLPSSFFGWNELEMIKKRLNDFMDEIIEEHIDTFDPNCPRDLIDHYLIEMQNKGLHFNDEDNGTIYARSFMRTNMSVLFIAGTDTTANTLTFAIKLLLVHPEIQKKMQEEIDRVVGRARLPAWSDRDQLPYTSATILEIHRFFSIVPTSPVHTNTEEIVFRGFTIPKETFFLANLYQVHHDPSLWNNPEKFDPNRFINEEGKVVKPDYLIPFSAGRRACLGENLANMEVFIFFACLLQNFSFLPVDETSKKLEMIHGFVRKLPPFKVKIEPR